MKYKLFILACFTFLMVISDIVLLVRYRSWGNGWDSLTPFTFFLLLAEGLVIYSFAKFEQIINPLTIYSVFIYIAGFSFLAISGKQEHYSPLFLSVLLLSIFSFIVGGLVSIMTFPIAIKNIISPLKADLSLFLLLFFFVAGIGVFAMEIRQLGYLPVLNLGGSSVYDDLVENEVSPLHNFIVLNSVLPAIFYALYKKKTIPFYVFLGLSMVCAFIILNFFSRQIIMLFFFSMLMAIGFYRNISFIKLIGITICIVFLFIILGELRSSSGNDVNAISINDFLKEYAGIKQPTNILETYLSLYGSINFTTANRLITLASDNNYVSYGAYSARPLLTVLPVSKSALYPAEYSSYSQLGTYLVDPYLDFRWAGVICLNFVYGFFSMNSFKNYLSRKSPYYIVEWSLFMFCIFMCAFTNFFHMFFVLFFFTINRIALK